MVAKWLRLRMSWPRLASWPFGQVVTITFCFGLLSFLGFHSVDLNLRTQEGDSDARESLTFHVTPDGVNLLSARRWSRNIPNRDHIIAQSSFYCP